LFNGFTDNLLKIAAALVYPTVVAPCWVCYASRIGYLYACYYMLHLPTNWL